MKAQDLRLGNLFNEKHSGQLIKVIGLTDKEITFDGKFPYKWQYEPIALTEEWLIKLGFDNGTLEHSQVGFIDDDFINGEMTFMFNKDWITKVKYVHQLQNIYHALTGEELQLTNKKKD